MLSCGFCKIVLYTICYFLRLIFFTQHYASKIYPRCLCIFLSFIGYHNPLCDYPISDPEVWKLSEKKNLFLPFLYIIVHSCISSTFMYIIWHICTGLYHRHIPKKWDFWVVGYSVDQLWEKMSNCFYKVVCTLKSLECLPSSSVWEFPLFHILTN